MDTARRHEDLSEHTIELLLSHGFRYDSSLMGSDYLPYRARRGDVAKLGEPYHFGEETALIEMPISWSLDDYPHFEFVRTPSTILPGLQPARAVMQSWLDEFLYMKKTVDWGVLTYTMHPYVIGRGYRMLALEDMVDKLASEGAWSLKALTTVCPLMRDAPQQHAVVRVGPSPSPGPFSLVVCQIRVADLPSQRSASSRVTASPWEPVFCRGYSRGHEAPVLSARAATKFSGCQLVLKVISSSPGVAC